MLSIHNSLSRQKEEFRPQEPGKVRMYVCGPTVYGPGHIGHARTYIAFDVIRRYLEFSGYAVTFVVNITDIHDDMIAQANKEGITIFQLAEKNIPLFFGDLDALGIRRADFSPRVTETIPEIIELVQLLVQKGFAYETEDGVYFSIDRFKEYGTLSRLVREKQVGGTRVQTDKYDKTNPMDFALWKKAKPEEPSWDSPWGAGRPGWHIECSAMSRKILGNQLDIHGGAADLMFPHHENEIAQSECALGIHPFVRYWMHTGFLNVDGEKMSKSLGNFITLPQLLKNTDARSFRFFIVLSHYRSPVDFTENSLENAKESLQRFDSLIESLQEVQQKGPSHAEMDGLLQKTRMAIKTALDDDFNFPKCWAELFEFSRKINSFIHAEQKMTETDAQKVLAFLKEINSVFGVFEFEVKKTDLETEVNELIAERGRLRAQKKFAQADAIRARLKEKGIELMDSPTGVKWKKIH
ncbi:MAG: cysteine--tRNA ligase [Candidatus Diapherotrites archaeon]|nr:cysteine--tRNA ligase [Candidatus Diapherotrites archaeon]